MRRIITSREPQTAFCPSYHSTPFPCLPPMHDIAVFSKPRELKLLCPHSKGKATEAERPCPEPQWQDSSGLHRQIPRTRRPATPRSSPHEAMALLLTLWYPSLPHFDLCLGTQPRTGAAAGAVDFDRQGHSVWLALMASLAEGDPSDYST